MKDFKTYTSSLLEDKKESKKEKGNKDTSSMSEIGEWTRTKDGWIVRFKVAGNEYVISFSPLDESEKHWKFTYYSLGQRDSSDIKKFGEVSSWVDIWKSLVEIIKDFIRIFKPGTLKFIGMSISKRGSAYRDLFKIYIKEFLNSFRKLGYHATFDYKDLAMAPSFVIRKGDMKEPEKKESEQKVDEHIVKLDNGKYRLVAKKSGRNLGTYDTRAGAEKRERQVQFFSKHKG